MLISYLKLALRLIARHPFYTFINVAGLSIGLVAFYILWPYAQYELSSDQFHHDYEQIARLSTAFTFNENGNVKHLRIPVHNYGIASRIEKTYPEVVDLTGITPQQFFEHDRQGFDKDVFIAVDAGSKEKSLFQEQNLAFADSNFFQFFAFPLLVGDAREVLRHPNTAVVSASHAARYFGEDNPVNKVIYFNDSTPYTITGVFKDLPRNTHFKADVLLSTAGIRELDNYDAAKGWWTYTYIKVARGTNFQALEEKINGDKDRLYDNCPQCVDNNTTSVFIQPLSSVVFTNLTANTFHSKSRYLLIILSVLAFAIPGLAWINYVSLSINMFQKRLSEMGIRKVAGAESKHFVMQFIVEALILHTLSFFVALTVIQLTKGPLESLLAFYAVPWTELPPGTISIVIVLFATGIIVTIAYPLFMSVNGRSVSLVKKTSRYNAPPWLNAIVTTQYTVAIALLICISCVYSQLNFILSRPLGLTSDGIIVIDSPLKIRSNFTHGIEYFTTNASTTPGVLGVTVSKNVVGDFAGYGIPLKRLPEAPEFGLDINGGVDENFVDVYHINLLHGRNFQADMPSDRNAILISRDATVRLGFDSPRDAIGARLILPWYNQANVEVIGVYEDYEFRPFLSGTYEAKRGSFLAFRNHLMPDLYPSKISLRVDYATLQSTVQKLEQLFKSTFPNDTFRWTFLDENIQKYYLTEKVARNQIAAFTLIAVGIACLGLLGLITNKVTEKTKEIGIRKVLGARLRNIAQILLATTSKQLLVAVAISLPLAYFATQFYLEKFSERVTLQWWHFTLPVVVLITIMLSTVASVLWRACHSNPVDALKHE